MQYSRWLETTNNKLCCLKNTVTPWVSSCWKTWWEKVVFAQLRIGHTCPTHSHTCCVREIHGVTLVGSPSKFSMFSLPVRSSRCCSTAWDSVVTFQLHLGATPRLWRGPFYMWNRLVSLPNFKLCAIFMSYWPSILLIIYTLAFPFIWSNLLPFDNFI